MDTDRDGKVTYEELKAGLRKVGSQLAEPEIKMLMEVVSFHGYLPFTIEIPLLISVLSLSLSENLSDESPGNQFSGLLVHNVLDVCAPSSEHPVFSSNEVPILFNPA